MSLKGINIEMPDKRTYYVSFDSNGDVYGFRVIYQRETRRFGGKRTVSRYCRPRPDVVEAARKAIAQRDLNPGQ